MPDSDEDLERLLRNARPAPRPGYTRELEGSLALPGRSKPGARRWLGIGVAALIVVMLVALAAGWL